MKSKIISLFVLLVFFMSGCNFYTSKVESITIVGDYLLDVGEVKALEIVLEPEEKVKILFVSSDEDILTIDEDGYLQGISPGTATITASLKNNSKINDTVEVIVQNPKVDDLFISGPSELFLNSTAALTILTNPDNASKDVIWESSNKDILVVAENGLVTGVGIGTVEVKATSREDFTKIGKLTIRVIPGSVDDFEIIGSDLVKLGEQVNYIVMSAGMDVSSYFTFSVSNEEKATITSRGNFTGHSLGKVVITATLISNQDLTSSLEIEIEEAQIKDIFITGPTEVQINSTIILTITINPDDANKNVYWESSNEELAIVNSEGIVTGLKLGIVEIRAISSVDSNVVGKININIIPDPSYAVEIIGPKSLDLDEQVQLKVISAGVDVSDNYQWESLNAEIATIDEVGLVLGHSPGKVVIRVIDKINNEIYHDFEMNVGIYYKSSKILTLNRETNYIELFNIGATKLDEKTRILKYDGSKVTPGTISDLYVGMENIYVEYIRNNDYVQAILIDGAPGYANIRVGIRKSIHDISDDSTRFHDSIDLTILKNSKIQIYDGSSEVAIAEGSKINLKNSNGKIIVTSNGYTILESNKRVIIIPEDDEEAIRIDSISRNSNQEYSGNLEVSIYLGRMLVVNDIDLEDYLYKVVPSEMPASYNLEALKAQAIAARTYAYKDILNRTFERYGYTVDDSVQSQVYNNGNAHPNSTNAVDQTKGLIMMSGGELVNAFYYSTSAGITASAHEVWIDNNNINPKITPYLIGQNHTTDNAGNIIDFDYTDEANMLSFFKRITVNTPDNKISFHRWRVSFNKVQLTKTLSKNLTLRYASTPNLVLTKVGTEFVSLPITTNIGDVQRVYVGRRGTSGVVISLIIETTTNTYEIINQYNIRFALRPQDAGVSNQTATATNPNYGNSGSNSILFSGFFAIEENNGVFTFYGGGNGHGVGISQNGANTLGKDGKSYSEILSAYYTNMELIDISYDYQSLPNFEDLF